MKTSCYFEIKTGAATLNEDIGYYFKMKIEALL
jgi:hypothetical protein